MKQKFPQEANRHLDAIIEIFSQVASEQSEKARELKEKGEDIAVLKEEALESLQEAKDRHELSELRLLEIDKEYEKISKITAYFEETADKEKKELEGTLLKIKRIREETKAELVNIEKEREGLKQKESQLKDKEIALERSWAELKRKRLELGMV